MLQINSEIFKRVIIARQGHIAGLFSGEQAIREQVFQKIFVVPPTEKIRRVIWENYIKEAPPELPLEDIDELQAQEQQFVATIHQLRLEQSKILVHPEAEIDRLKNRVIFLQKCKVDMHNQENYSVKLADCQQELLTVKKEEKELKDKLSSIDINHFRQIKTILDQQKPLYEQKLVLEAQLEKHKDIDKKLSEVRVKMGKLHIPIAQAKIDKDGIEHRLADIPGRCNNSKTLILRRGVHCVIMKYTT